MNKFLISVYICLFGFSAQAVTGYVGVNKSQYIKMADLEFKFYSQASISATGTLAIPGDVVAKPYTQEGLAEAVMVTKLNLEERFNDFQQALNATLSQHTPMSPTNMSNLLESIFGYVSAVTADMKDYLPKNRISMVFVIMPGQRVISQSHQPLLTENKSLRKINLALRSMRQALVDIKPERLPPLSPMGFLIRVELEQGHSQVVVQTVAALNPFEKPLEQSTESAEFSAVVVPRVYSENGAPVVLSTITIPLFEKDVWPSFDLRFGYDAKLETDDGADDFLITIKDNSFMCSEVSAFPYLSGYEMYTGYIPIRAYIKSAKFDIKELEVSLLEVRAGVAPGGCFNQDVEHKSLVSGYGGNNPQFSEFWNEVTSWIGLSLEELHGVVEKERASSPLFKSIN